MPEQVETRRREEIPWKKVGIFILILIIFGGEVAWRTVWESELAKQVVDALKTGKIRMRRNEYNDTDIE